MLCWLVWFGSLGLVVPLVVRTGLFCRNRFWIPFPCCLRVSCLVCCRNRFWIPFLLVVFGFSVPYVLPESFLDSLPLCCCWVSRPTCYTGIVSGFLFLFVFRVLCVPGFAGIVSGFLFLVCSRVPRFVSFCRNRFCQLYIVYPFPKHCKNKTKKFLCVQDIIKRLSIVFPCPK